MFPPVEKSSAEIGNTIDEKEKDYREAVKNISSVEQEILIIQKQIIDLQGKKKDLELIKCKATQNIRLLSSELRVLKQSFWASKNSGL